MQPILALNLLGKRFHIPYQIVNNYPDTLLGNQSLLSEYYRHETNDYYFERNPLLLPYILTYYTLEKKILCPHNIPIELLRDELTYQYIPRDKTSKIDSLIIITSFIIGLLYMITISMETSNNDFSHSSWSLTYFIELVCIVLLTSIVLYQAIYKQDLLRNKSFLSVLFSTILSILIIVSHNLMTITNHDFINRFIMLAKAFRLFIIIAHFPLLKLITKTFIHRLQTIFILVFINIIIAGSLSEITFAFERQQQENQTTQLTMKTHLDAFWWATSLSFTIGFGHIDAHFTLTPIGRFCGYMLIFFGLLFNGLMLQELIKGFLKIYREETGDQ